MNTPDRLRALSDEAHRLLLHAADEETRVALHEACKWLSVAVLMNRQARAIYDRQARERMESGANQYSPVENLPQGTAKARDAARARAIYDRQHQRPE